MPTASIWSIVATTGAQAYPLTIANMVRLTIPQVRRIIEVLEIPEDENGDFRTTWGRKTLNGLRETIEELVSTEPTT